MNTSIFNFTGTETSNSTSPYIQRISCLEICVYVFSLVFGLPTQVYVIWLITGTENRIPSEFFKLNLSVCEIVNCVNCLCYVLLNWFPSLFRITSSLSGLGITCRPLFECLICVERYLAVVHPVTFLKFKPLRYKLMCSAVGWIISLASCLFSSYMVVLYLTYGHLWFFLTQFSTFISIQLFCCVAVLRVLKKSGPGERRREEENHMKRRAFYLILITTLNMLFMYAPVSITALFTILTQKNIHELWILSSICYAVPSFVQPVLYLHRARKLQCLLFDCRCT